MAALVTERRVLLGVEQRARVSAEATNRAKDEFLAMLGHELRNPLSAITMALEVVDHSSTLEGKAAHAQSIIARQLGQLVQLVDELLDVTRVTTGKIVLNRAPVDLADLVARVLDTFSVAQRTRLHRVELHRQPAWVDGDVTRLGQIVTNLVGNALKYTLPGGKISVKVGNERGQATLRVSDTGIGIAHVLLPQVFDLFTQGERGSDRAQGGLGIGLTLVRYLVALHGGTVEATSDGPNRGSEFIVRLPAVSPPAASMPEMTDVSLPSRPIGSHRVLVVDDRADVLDSLRVMLEEAGYQVFEATDGPGAVEAVERVHPAAAIVDIGLPVFDGYEVAKRVRRLPNGRSMLLVALTGFGQPQARQSAEAAGFDLFLLKPVTSVRLREVLQSQPLN
jgi:CheY-like chemotaxis protein/two-component sensor histidine kinase